MIQGIKIRHNIYYANSSGSHTLKLSIKASIGFISLRLKILHLQPLTLSPTNNSKVHILILATTTRLEHLLAPHCHH